MRLVLLKSMPRKLAQHWPDLLGLMLLFAGTGLWLGGQQVRAWPEPGPVPEPYQSVVVEPVLVPHLKRGDAALADSFVATLSAESVWVSDEASAQVLLTKNPDQPRALASTTKLMTALVARQWYPLDEVVTVGAEAFTTGNVVGLEQGEQLTVEQLLYGLLIPSGNDAAFALANHFSAGYDGFVTEMNRQAMALKLKNTQFKNPSGLDQSGHYATAHDLAILAREVFKDPFLRHIMGKTEQNIADISGQTQHSLVTTHQLLKENPQVVGGKTGTTFEAGETLITLVEIQGHLVQIVVMKSQDRYFDTTQIIEWLSQHYTWSNSMQ